MLSNDANKYNAKKATHLINTPIRITIGVLHVRLDCHIISTNHRFYHHGYGIHPVHSNRMDSVPTNYGSYGCCMQVERKP